MTDTDDSVWSLPRLNHLFSRHLLQPLDHYPELVDKFFVARNGEAAQLLARIDQIVLRGGNVLVVGDRGVGKSSFLKWFLERSSRSSSTISNHICRVIDMKKHPGSLDREELLTSVQLEVIEASIDYLSQCHHHPCHEISELIGNDQIPIAYRKIGKLINSLPSTEKQLLLFIDDIDYVDHTHFHELLARLKPFLSSHNASVILAARRPAANALHSHSDTTIAQFFEPHSRLTLSHLEVHSVLAARMEVLGNDQTLENIIKDVKSSLTELYRDLVDLITNDNDLSNRKVRGLPFTDHQLSFIQETSNGNIKSMLMLSRLFLQYMAEHYPDLQRNTLGHVRIGRERLVEEMGENVAGENEKYGALRIVNLHKRKSLEFKTRAAIKRDQIEPELIGNSLYVCLLEIIMEFETLNETHRRQMRENYGFEDLEIDEAIVELHEMGMIEEKRLAELRALDGTISLGKEFELTRRGRYYMEWLIHWDCYIERYGVSKHHQLGVSISQKNMVARALQEFVIAVAIAWPFVRPEGAPKDRFRIKKVVFAEAFADVASPLLRRANRTDRIKALIVTPNHIEKLLTEWRLVTIHGIDNNRSFLFNLPAIKTYASRNNLEWITSFMFEEADVLTFAKENCQTIEGS